jgi:predicted outer membrane protein
MDARLDHRLAWIIAAALVGAAACSGNDEGGTNDNTANGRDGGAKSLAACLGPSWFGSGDATKTDACRTKTIDLVCSPKGTSKGPATRPLAKESKSCTGVFVVRSDADIQGILSALDDGQLAMAKLATQNGSSQAVKDLAAKMTTEHTASRARRRTMLERSTAQQAEALRAPAHKSPVPKSPAPAKTTGGESDISRTLTKGFGDTEKSLEGLKGADFDREFLAREIIEHQNTVDLLDELDHQAKSADVRTAVENERTLEQAHQKLFCDARAAMTDMSTTHADEVDEGPAVDACEAAPE